MEPPVRMESASPGVRRGTKAQKYLLVWWLDQTPQVACVDDPIEAEAAARERNATVVEIRGRDIEVAQVLDYWRRDAAGRPMPARWKDLKQPVGWRIPLIRPRVPSDSSPDP